MQNAKYYKLTQGFLHNVIQMSLIYKLDVKITKMMSSAKVLVCLDTG